MPCASAKVVVWPNESSTRIGSTLASGATRATSPATIVPCPRCGPGPVSARLSLSSRKLYPPGAMRPAKNGCARSMPESITATTTSRPVDTCSPSGTPISPGVGSLTNAGLLDARKNVCVEPLGSTS